MQNRPLLFFFLSLLLAIFTVPASATLVAGSEKQVTAPVVDVAAFGQNHARIASDGTSYLAVWIDHGGQFGSGDVHGMLITSDGKRAGNDVLPIATSALDEAGVGIGFGAGRYLVVWAAHGVVRGRFVAPDGTMSDVFDISPIDPFTQTQPQIAFNGSRFLVTWFDQPIFRGALIESNGTVLKTFDIASRQATWFETPTVSVDGSFRFISSITDFNGVPNGNGYPGDVGVTTIDAEGNVGTRVVVAPATTPVFDLLAVSTGNDFVIAWSTAIAIPGGTVRAVRVTPSGAGAIEIIPSEGMYLHDVGADAGGVFVIYGADTTKHLRRLGTTVSSDVAVPPTPNAVLDVAGSIAIVRGNPRLGFEFGPAGGDLYVLRLDTGDLEPLVVAPRHQQQPDVAGGLAVWCEYIGSERRLGIIASRLSDGTPIDLNVNVYHPVAPRVASNGSGWLVIWVDAAKVYGTRIAQDGTLIDATPMVIASSIYSDSDVAVSWDGTQWVVAYFRGQSMRGLRTTARVARVPAQGSITAPELTLSAEGANEFPSIASSPQGSLVLWRGANFTLNGAMLSPGGTITPVAFPTVFSMPRPSVAWNNGTFLVAAPLRGTFGDQVQWMLVSNTGVVTTPTSAFVEIANTSTGSYSSVETEAFGDGFLVYWKGNGSDVVYAARVNAAGALVDAAKAVGITRPSYGPSFGASGSTVVYARKVERENARVFAREVLRVEGNPRRRAVR